ncbi:acyltransferase family protein [Flavobacterium sp. W21_SRS_FM6]
MSTKLPQYLTAGTVMTQEQALQNVRRYDIDWLRTLAFAVLILYHVGMYYVFEWGWHVKSPNQSEWLQDLMIMTNQWRMSLLFFISGLALALVSHKYAGWRLARLRSNRLFVPLIFSMYFIVAPQLFYELQQNAGLTMDYWSFLQEYWNVDTALAPEKHTSIGLLTWNHLWFLPYLWVYSMLFLMGRPLINLLLLRWGPNSIPLWIFVSVLLIVSAFTWLTLSRHFPSTHNLLHDWYNHAHYFFVFLAGALLVNFGALWQSLIAKRRVFALFALLGYVWLIMDRHGYLDVGDELDQLWLIQFAHGLLLSINHWAWIFALIGYAGRYLNFSNRFLSYANEAILPWYIFHQTLIIIFAMQLLPFDLPAILEAPILILLTSLGCLVGYEVVRRTWLTRWLFGLKVSVTKSHHAVLTIEGK